MATFELLIGLFAAIAVVAAGLGVPFLFHQPLMVADGLPRTVMGSLGPDPFPVAAAGLASHEGLPVRRSGGSGPALAWSRVRSGR